MSDFEQLFSTATAIYDGTKSDVQGAEQRFGIGFKNNAIYSSNCFAFS
jgi:hypothetical protein